MEKSRLKMKMEKYLHKEWWKKSTTSATKKAIYFYPIMNLRESLFILHSREETISEMKSHARMLLKPQQQHGMNKQGMQLNGDFSFEFIYIWKK